MTRRTIWRQVGLLVLSLVSLAAPTFSANVDDMTPVRFAVLGDRTGDHVPGVYEQIVEEVARLRPDFVMTVGDMIEGFTDDSVQLAEQWQEYRYLISPLVAPIHFTPGNHELSSDRAAAAYKENVGRTYYSFNFDRVHIVVLDVARWETAEEMPPEQLAWLEKDLKTFKNSLYTMVFMHKPFWWETVVHSRPDTLHSLFKKYGVDAVFAGHFHDYFSIDYQGIQYTCLGSSGGGMEGDFGDLGYHFLYVTLDSRGVHIAPIKMGSVQPWDIMTIADRKVYQAMKYQGLTFARPIPVSEDLKVAGTTVQYTVDNTSGNYPVNDTLTWESSPEWHINPRTQAVSVPPHQSRTYSVNLQCKRVGFPPPTAHLNFQYALEHSVAVHQPLPLARVASCVRAAGLPIVDGLLSEVIWKDPETRYFDPTGKATEVEPTEVYFAYDDQNLYLAARCRESQPDLMKVKADKHDGAIASEDCLGFFIAPPGEMVQAFQIYFNPDGIAFDQRFEQDAEGFMQGDLAWDGQYEVKTQRFADGWTLEARIPLATFGVWLAQGDTWRVNFRRKQARLTKAADWQTPIEYDPRTFGLLIAR